MVFSAEATGSESAGGVVRSMERITYRSESEERKFIP